MTELSAEAKQKVLALKQAYIDSLPEKIQQLEKYWQSIQSNQFKLNDIEQLRGYCHKIAGSSGSYELQEISHAAHRLEKLCVNEKLSDEVKPGAEQPEEDRLDRASIEVSFYALLQQIQQAK